jgi:hypothetical protein
MTVRPKFDIRHAPVAFKVTTHREKGPKKEKLGHVGYVQERTDVSMRLFGGKRWAAWARRTVNGIETGTPERFDTYEAESEAQAHAVYAASKVTPTLCELMASGRRQP